MLTNPPPCCQNRSAPERYCCKKRVPKSLRTPFRLAVRTRLELATPCVTGMYSNQTELPDLLHHDLKTSLFLKCGCKSTTFFPFSKEKNDFFWKYFLYHLTVNYLKIHISCNPTSKISCKTAYFTLEFQKIRVLAHILSSNYVPSEKEHWYSLQYIHSHCCASSAIPLSIRCWKKNTSEQPKKTNPSMRDDFIKFIPHWGIFCIFAPRNNYKNGRRISLSVYGQTCYKNNVTF